MKKWYLILCGLLLTMPCRTYAEEKEEKKEIPAHMRWEETNDRSNRTPVLLQSQSYVYVYTEKQIDNAYVAITDAQGNVYYEIYTILPACEYYAISTETLPEGAYYLTVIQGGNYVMGTFSK